MSVYDAGRWRNRSGLTQPQKRERVVLRNQVGGVYRYQKIRNDVLNINLRINSIHALLGMKRGHDSQVPSCREAQNPDALRINSKLLAARS
jgi:hypothetical protein